MTEEPGGCSAGDSLDTVIHIVTLLYRSEALLAGFLRGLAAQDFPDWRLILVDNGSEDAALDIVRSLWDPRITLLRNARNEGFARGVNRGIDWGLRQGARRFLILNDDTAFAADFLGSLLQAWTRAGAMVVAPRIMGIEMPDSPWYAGARFERGWLFRHVPEPFDPDDARPARQVEFAPGCCLGIAAEVFERIGLFDESFFVYWEDADLCMRLISAGIPVTYLRDPSLQHAGGASSGGQFSIPYIRLYYRSYMQFLRKHFGPWHAFRSFYRIALRESARDWRDPAKAASTIRAMLAGLVAPLRPVPAGDTSGGRG